MGKSALSGPVYGSKSLLWSYGPFTVSSGATTTVFANRTLPNYEDWYITEMHVTVSTCSSVGNSIQLKSEGGSTTGITRLTGALPSTQAQTIFNLNTGTSTTFSTWATATATPGEYEGLFVPAGSSMHLVSSGVNGLGQCHIQVMGYIRWVSSTRAES